MKKIGIVLVAVMVVAIAGFVSCAGQPRAVAVAPAPVPEIVITGTHSAGSGDMQLQGFRGGAVEATIEADGSFTLVLEAGSVIEIPGWDDGAPGGRIPFLGNSVATGTGPYTVTGITVGGVDIRALLGVADWAGVLDSPNFPSRGATLTATPYGIEATDRGTGPHCNNNGLRINVAALARLFADMPAGAQPVVAEYVGVEYAYAEYAYELYE